MNRAQTVQAASVPRGPRPPGYRDWLAAAGILLATLAAYWPVLRAGFIWDDDGFVTRTDLRTWHGLARIWTDLGATEQYYPLLHSAFWVEWRLWGNAPAGYHLVNVLLHAAAACLLALVLRRWSVRGAWLAALLFALHPVCVESVAWIAEQKNTLSTVFYLLAAYVYLGAEAEGGEAGSSVPSLGRYCWASLLFLLALLSKTVAATLPAALLVALWWRRGKLTRREVAPLVPWLVLGAAAGLFSGWVERTYIGASGAAFALSFGERCLLAGRAIWFYLGKLVWPTNLIFIYPRWTVDARALWQYLFPLAALAVIAGLWGLRRASRAPLAVGLIFVGSLFPTLGFFNVYAFVFSYVADHWQYLASLAVLAAAAAVAVRLPPRIGSPPVRALAWILISACPAILGILTWNQARTYRDVETFYRTILARNPACWLAQDNLGAVLANTGRLPEALVHYEAALQLNANFPQTYNNFGNALARLRRWPEAFAAYQRALALRPGFFEAEYDWGSALSELGKFAEAAAHFEAAFRLRPDYPEAQYGWANALANQGQFDLAMAHYREALRLRPAYPEARANYGLALVSAGQPEEAARQLEAALQLRPNYAEAHAYLGLALARGGRLPEAVAEFRASLRLNPGDADTHRQLALALRALGQTEEALREFELAERLSTP
jgi:tetratricopeptide (TPR) repeat protein